LPASPDGSGFVGVAGVASGGGHPSRTTILPLDPRVRQGWAYIVTLL
jgi:hypothetical protein